MASKLDTPEAKKIITNVVENANLNEVESFIMAEVAADFLNGIRWVLLYKDSPQFKAKLSMLKAAIQGGQLHNKVGLKELADGCIVELDAELILNTLASMQKKLPGVDVKQDFNLATEAFKRTKTDLNKYLKSKIVELSKGAPVVKEKIGIYCVNETPKITFSTEKGLVSVPAFRLAASDLYQTKTMLRNQGYDLEYTNFKLSPSKTGVLVDLKLSKLKV